MKNKIINKTISKIKKETNYDEVKISEIKYGLNTLYITITKTIVVFTLSYFIGIFYELLLFFTFYSILRITGNGLHAKKSWQCWIYSIIIFLIIPFICKTIALNIYIKLFICFITTLLIFIYAPADTEKKPIVNIKKRLIFKIVCTTNSLIYCVIILISQNILLTNSLVFSLILQTLLILPITYKILNLKYNNYKTYRSLNVSS